MTPTCDGESIKTSETSLVGAKFVDDAICKKGPSSNDLLEARLVVLEELQDMGYLLLCMFKSLVGFDGNWTLDKDPSIEIKYDGVKHTVVTSHPVDELSFFETQARSVESIDIISNGIKEKTLISDEKSPKRKWLVFGKKNKTFSVEVSYDGSNHTIVSSQPLASTDGQETIESIDVLPNKVPLRRRKSFFSRSFKGKRSENGLPPTFPRSTSMKHSPSFFSKKRTATETPFDESSPTFPQETPMKNSKSFFRKKRVPTEIAFDASPPSLCSEEEAL